MLQHIFHERQVNEGALLGIVNETEVVSDFIKLYLKALLKVSLHLSSLVLSDALKRFLVNDKCEFAENDLFGKPAVV